MGTYWEFSSVWLIISIATVPNMGLIVIKPAVQIGRRKCRYNLLTNLNLAELKIKIG